MAIDGPRITRIVGVYNAEGTLRGEITYLLRRAFADQHCALCDITHGRFRRRPSWDRCSTEFTRRRGLSMELVHLDDVPANIREHTEFCAPSIFAQFSNGSVERIMSPQDLESCDHSPPRLFEILEQRLASSP